MDQGQAATAKETFDALIDNLRGHRPMLFDNVAKVTGFLLLAIGWLATSKDARAFFGTNPLIKYSFACAFLLLGSMTIASCIMAHRFSLRMLDLMRELNVMDSKYYEIFAIDKYIATICSTDIGILAILAAVFIASV
jgi:hypothetical protein